MEDLPWWSESFINLFEIDGKESRRKGKWGRKKDKGEGKKEDGGGKEEDKKSANGKLGKNEKADQHGAVQSVRSDGHSALATIKQDR